MVQRNRLKYFGGMIVAILVCFWAVRPLFVTGFFPMHDDTQVSRVIEMKRALSEGQFPVRWVSDLGYGYGYPIFNFYAPLPYYFGGFLNFLTDSLTATKIMFGAGIILSSVCMYLFLYPITGALASIIGSTVFVYSPYHAVQVYVRGSVGEYWSIAFVPLILLGLHMSYARKSKLTGTLLGGIGLAGSIVSHTILGYLIFVYFIFLVAGISAYLHVSKKLKRSFLALSLLIAVFGLGLSAFFWIPAYGEMQHTQVAAMITDAKSGFYDHFLCPIQLWNSPWGFAGSSPDCLSDGMSFKLGKFTILLAAASLFWMIYLRFRKKITSVPKWYAVSLGTFCISIISVLGISRIFWRIIPFAEFVQYPWRMLTFSMLASGILSSFVLLRVKKLTYRILVTVVVVAITLILHAKLFVPQFVIPSTTRQYETPGDLSFRVSKISDEYLPKDFKKPKHESELPGRLLDVAPGTRVNVINLRGTRIVASIYSYKNQIIGVNRAYFPGWVYLVNGTKVDPTVRRGLPSFPVGTGKSIIEMRLKDTRIRRIANIISVLTILYMAGVIVYAKKAAS